MKDIYAKTPAGQQEIVDRGRRLHPRLRSLLVLIDGRRHAEELLLTLSTIGVTGASLEELQQLGLIARCEPAKPPAEPANCESQSDDGLYSYFTPPA